MEERRRCAGFFFTSETGCSACTPSLAPRSPSWLQPPRLVSPPGHALAVSKRYYLDTWSRLGVFIRRGRVRFFLSTPLDFSFSSATSCPLLLLFVFPSFSLFTNALAVWCFSSRSHITFSCVVKIVVVKATVFFPPLTRRNRFRARSLE